MKIKKNKAPQNENLKTNKFQLFKTIAQKINIIYSPNYIQSRISNEKTFVPQKYFSITSHLRLTKYLNHDTLIVIHLKLFKFFKMLHQKFLFFNN